MGLNDIDFEAVFRRLADKRVEDAMAEGKFDNLPGHGDPIEIDEAPADENARALWWALRIMKQADFVPDEVRWRKAVDQLKGDLFKETNPVAVRSLCNRINALVHKLNTLGTNAIHIALTPVDTEAEVRTRSGPNIGTAWSE